MKILAIIQARMESTRLPKKVLTELCKKPMLWHIFQRVSQSTYINHTALATSTNQADNELEEFAKRNNFFFFRGSQENVLERFYRCAALFKPDLVIRLTGDNALIDPKIIDQGVETYLQEPDLDYLYFREGLPLGMAVEIMRFDALERAFSEAGEPDCFEHVTPYLYKNPHLFHSKRVPNIGRDYSHLRWTMDTKEDYLLISSIYNALYQEKQFFYYEDILNAYETHREWFTINSAIEQVKVTYTGEKKEAYL